MPFTERLHLNTLNGMRSIGLLGSRVNRRPVRIEMKTISCKQGQNFFQTQRNSSLIFTPTFLEPMLIIAGYSLTSDLGLCF